MTQQGVWCRADMGRVTTSIPADGVVVSATERARLRRARREFLRLERLAAENAEKPPAPIPFLTLSGDADVLRHRHGLRGQMCARCQRRLPGDAGWVGDVSGLVLCSQACVVEQRRHILLTGVPKGCRRCRRRVDLAGAGWVVRDGVAWHERCWERHGAAA